jgi:hypothetical protein
MARAHEGEVKGAGRTRARPAVRYPGVATPEGEQKDAWEKMTDGSKIAAAIMVA